ncbi:MAG: acyltransferase family protein [Acidimicrobiales bacterium]|jgi:peptidoglycan/LPS O-acetylase OafA/YrhL
MSTVTDGPATAPEAGTADEAGTAPGDRRFRPDVEGLRAVAVLLVVLYHAGLPGLGGGYVGVDVFFVISGFVITGLLLRERTSTGATSLVAFYSRRVRRILPAATLVIVSTVVLTYLVLGVVYGDPTAVTARWTAVFLANFHFADTATSYLNATLPPSPLQNFWSLAVEEQFYLVYPAIFLVVASLRSTVSLRARLIATLIPIIAMSLVISAAQTATNPNGAYFSPLTRAWELALGALVAAATPALLRLPRTVATAMTWLGLAAIGFAAVTYSSASQYPGTLVIIPVVGTALVIAGGTPVPSWAAERVLRIAPLQWFGRLSYSLYLWHWPILIIAAEEAGQNALPFHRNIPWLAVALVAAVATHVCVENPVRHSRALSRRRWLSIGLGAVLVATSLVVATVALDVSGAASSTGHGRAGPPAPLTPRELTRLVESAALIHTLPPDLRPALDQVRANWGGPPSSCWPKYAQTSVPACTFGDPRGKRTLVVYGDSHAAMWFDAINLIGLLSRWRVAILAKGDCPAIGLAFPAPPGSATPGARFAQCDEWHRFALARIDALHPDLVIVTQEADLGLGRSKYPESVWEAATVKLIRSLPVPSSRVLVLGNIPQFDGAGPGCLSLNPDDVQRCSGPDLPYDVEHDAAERRATIRTGARYIDTVPWFCSATCTDVIGQYLPYWDGFHITADYSIALSTVLSESIDLPAYPPLGTPTSSSSTASTG